MTTERRRVLHNTPMRYRRTRHMTHSLSRTGPAPYGSPCNPGEVPRRDTQPDNGRATMGAGQWHSKPAMRAARQHTLAGLSRPPRRAGTALIKRYSEPGGAVF